MLGNKMEGDGRAKFGLFWKVERFVYGGQLRLRCNKERRFRLRKNQGCRIYHDALAKRRWNCADKPYDEITFDDEEERASRKTGRGCPRSPISDLELLQFCPTTYADLERPKPSQLPTLMSATSANQGGMSKHPP
ncbi:hypothetical protein L1049_022745 [Liquidambar formosana]|uniref:ULTRAPETALA1/2 zinc finger domain-containing protein n=1 Tax=Liquidambar formosana TaxID=63359 RepID=A0AAP0RD12_LIQFO